MRRFLSGRAFLLAAASILAGAWLVQRVELLYGGPSLAGGVLPPLAVGVLVGLVLVRTLCRRLRLGRGELLAVYLMAAAGMPLASTGWAHYVLPGLVTGFYSFAGEGGRYLPFLQKMPQWMAPGGVESAAVSGFFEGAIGVPWSAWARPLLWWSALAGAFLATFLGLAGLLRRRWIEEERLRFPLAELPLELILRGGLLEKRSLWAGALVPMLLFGINGAHHYFQVPGEIPLSFNLAEVLTETPWSAMAPFTSRFFFYFSPFLVGLVYLMSLEVALGTWFFFLLSRLQLLFAEIAGRGQDQGTFVGLGGEWREWPNFFPHLYAQARGGLLCIALLSLWSARRALAQQARAALGGQFPRNGALWGLGGGFVLLVLWGWAAGLRPQWSAGYFLLLLLTAVGLARLRLDGGLPVVGLSFLIANVFYFAWGTGPGVFSPSEYLGFSFLNVLSYTGLLALFMLHFEGLKMGEALGVGGRRIALALGAGLVLGLAAGYWSMLETVYEHGLFALDQQGGGRAAARLGRYYHYLYAQAGTQGGTRDWARLGAMGFGFAVTGALALLRMFFLRWPFHPAGFVYGTGLGGLLWGPALVGWAVKSVVVRYGGAGTYRRLRPFFLGMILGELGMRLLWGGLALLGEPGGGYDWW